MPLSYPDRNHRRAPGLPAGRGGLRREPPGHRAGGGSRRLRPAPGRPVQRPPPDRPGPGPVHPPARRRRRLGGRRHHRVVAVRRRLRRDAQRLQHRRVVEAIGGEDTTADRCIIAVQGPHARTRLATVAPDAAAVPRFGVAPFVWDGVACVAAGTGYTGEDGVEWPCRPTPPTHCGPRCWPPASQPAGLGARDTLRLEAALPSTATSSARASPRSRPGWAGSSAGTRPQFRGRQALEAEREHGVPPAPGRAGHRRSPAAPAGVGRGRGRPSGGHGHQWQLLAHARPRHRPGLRGQPQSTPGRPADGLDIEQRGRSCRPRSSTTPFIRPGQWAAPGDGRRARHRALAPSSTRHRDTPIRGAARGHLHPAHRRRGGEHAGLPRPRLGRRSSSTWSRGPAAPAGLELADGVGEPDVLARHGGSGRPQPGPVRPPGLLRRRRRLRPRDPLGDPGAGRPLRVRHLVHALPARGGPGRAAGHLRVPDHGGPPGRAAGGQRLPLRRGQRRGRGRQPGGGRLGPGDGVGVGRDPPPLAPDARHLRRRHRAPASVPSPWSTGSPSGPRRSRGGRDRARRGPGRLPQLPRLHRGPGRGPRPSATGPGPCWWWGPTRWRPACSSRPGSGGPTSWWGRARSSAPPSGFGGPYLGLFACAEAHVRRLPGRLVGETVDVEGRGPTSPRSGPGSRTSAGRRPPPTSAPTRP